MLQRPCYPYLLRFGLSINPAGQMMPGPEGPMMQPAFCGLRIKRLSIIASSRTLPTGKPNPPSIRFVRLKRRLKNWSLLARMGSDGWIVKFINLSIL